MKDDILITIESLRDILSAFGNKILDRIEDVPKVLEPSNNDLPKIFITGDIPTEKEYVSGEMEYISKTHRFHAYTRIKLQGTSTLEHPKKNFSIKLYQDKDRTIELNEEFKHWGAHDNFVLKADYIDILHARNVVCAKLWSKVVESRHDYESLPKELKNSPNHGAIDGFPVIVYVNGRYEGLYNWTIPKCDWLFEMYKYNENHVVLSSEFNDNGVEHNANNPCNFNAIWSGSSEYFDIEVGNLTDNVINSINNIITSILDGEHDELEKYLDIQSAIDYYIFQDIIIGTDGLAKNMLLATYDMKKWYLSAYDMDSTLGLGWNGLFDRNIYDYVLPTDYLNIYSSLVDVILTHYYSQYCARYVELRNSVLSETSIINAFEEYIGVYGEDVYIQDTVPYPDIYNATTNTLDNLRTLIKNRLAFLDSRYMEVM